MVHLSLEHVERFLAKLAFLALLFHHFVNVEDIWQMLFSIVCEYLLALEFVKDVRVPSVVCGVI